MLSREEINDWVQNGPSNDLVVKVEEFGKEIQRGKLSTSQIRQVFTKVKAIEAKGITGRTGELVMLKPLLAYAASRVNKSNAEGINGLKGALTMGIEEVVAANSDDELARRYKNFCRFFEATLAYHRAAGGN